jgi:putative endonuclease
MKLVKSPACAIIFCMAPTLTLLQRLAKRLHPHTRGRLAEKLALLTYLARGWRPAPRPWRALAQTDLLLRRGQTLLLVEVKYRATPQSATKAVSPAQKQRLIRQMRALAGRHPTYTLAVEVCTLTLAPPSLARTRWLDAA